MDKKQYAELLKTDEWKSKRVTILKRDGFKCCKCGSKLSLHVHHKKYIKGKNPWQVPNSYLQTFTMKKLFIILSLSLISCDITKEASKTKTDRERTETTETKTTRKGDTVTYIIPNVIYKDTIIKTVSSHGTILRTYYDKSGTIYKSDCTAAEIEEYKRQVSQLSETIKEKSKTEELNTDWILYGFGAIVLLGSLALFLIYKSMNKNTELINGLINKV